MNDGVNDRAEVQVRICGYGGQGIVLAGMLLGKAASLYDGKLAVFTQAYGPEARGGASTADVVISDTTVDYPLVTEPDVLVALFQEAYTRYRPSLRHGGILIVEENLVRVYPDEIEHCAFPATRIAEGLGTKLVTNVVVLGYLVGKTGVVSRDAVLEAIKSTVKPKTIEMNVHAFDVGFEKAQSEVACHD